MPNPLQSDIHVNVPLTQISIAFLQNQMNFVADRVFPNIPVSKQSDRYYTYDRGEFNRDQMEVRAPATESAGGGYTVDNSPTYFAPVYAIHKDIADEQRNNSDPVINMERDSTNWVTHQGLIKREKLWAAKYFGTSIWDTDITGVSASPTGPQVLQWNDAASTPIEDIQAGKIAVLGQTGFEPNTLTMGAEVWSALRDHPDIVDRIKYGQTPGSPAQVTRQAVAALMELDEILVTKAIVNTAAEGQTPSHSFIGGKSALLSYRPSSPGILVPSAGYTFSWTGHLGAGAMGGRIKRFRMESLAADRIELEMAFDQKVVAPELGYFFTTVVA